MEGLFGPLFDFLKWLIMYIRGETKEEVDLKEIYNEKRSALSKPLVGLIEVFEEQPLRTFTTQDVFERWHATMEIWYGTERADEGTSKDGTFYALRDWANDEHPLIKKIDDGDSILWQLNEEYDLYRTHREEAQTVFRSTS